MTFNHFNFGAPIAKAIQACGYTKPTPIQAQAIPCVLDGKDVIASAQTGTGKTAAFVLPALQMLSNTPAEGKPRVLILSPTRELADQILKTIETYSKFMRIKIVCLVGGVAYFRQLKDVPRADIIVATPGRLLDIMQRGRTDLSGIKLVIFDEADRMLDMGFIDDVKTIAKATPQKRQTLLFSATVDKQLASIAQQLLKNPVRIDVSPQQMTSLQVKQELYRVNDLQHKSRLLQHFVDSKSVYKAIIFTATKSSADKLARQLCAQGYAAAALHGDLKQKVRYRTVEQLRTNKIQYLVATDVAARGINITDISHVFNYDLPKFPEDYVHRIGRTGRAGKTGIAISFALPTDGRSLQRIERYTGERVTQLTIPGLEPTKSFIAEPQAKKSFGNKRYLQNKGSSRHGEGRYKRPEERRSRAAHAYTPPGPRTTTDSRAATASRTHTTGSRKVTGARTTSGPSRYSETAPKSHRRAARFGGQRETIAAPAMTAANYSEGRFVKLSKPTIKVKHGARRNSVPQ